MSARTKARKRALDILFEADSKAVPVSSVLADTMRRRESAGDPPLNPHTMSIVEGIMAEQSAIDAAIEAAADGWTVARMPAVDRAILRVGAYEVMFADDVPTGVAISEAVDLASSLSTDESPSFVNGVLSAVARARVEN